MAETAQTFKTHRRTILSISTVGFCVDSITPLVTNRNLSDEQRQEILLPISDINRSSPSTSPFDSATTASIRADGCQPISAVMSSLRKNTNTSTPESTESTMSPESDITNSPQEINGTNVHKGIEIPCEDQQNQFENFALMIENDRKNKDISEMTILDDDQIHTMNKNETSLQAFNEQAQQEIVSTVEHQQDRDQHQEYAQQEHEQYLQNWQSPLNTLRVYKQLVELLAWCGTWESSLVLSLPHLSSADTFASRHKVAADYWLREITGL